MKKMKMICLGVGLAFVFALSGCGSASNSGTSEAPKNAEPAESPSAGLTESKSDTALPASEDPNGEVGDITNGRYTEDYELTSNEEYLEISENKETNTLEKSLLTFSLKVDTASYRNVVRYIESGNLPPQDAVKIEEMINYFNYDEVLQENDSPFSVYTEIGPSIFDGNKKLAFVRVKSKDIDKEDLPKSNLTFLIDTSGSMDSYDKLPLLKSAFGLLVETLTEDDVVSIVTYAGSSAIVLDSVHGDQKEKILKAINHLDARGSTAGADGILTAYKLAEKNFISEGNNRVLLATDGDFNVGPSGVDELETLIGEKRGNGVYLSVLGFGTENLKDNTMETLSKNGNGNYGYIDSVVAAKKILVDELSANLFIIADDVKAQVEFNPQLVSSYRLIGYENRKLENKDFENDKKDAGEIGVGTDVILMFEMELADGQNSQSLKYQQNEQAQEQDETAATEYADELFEVRIRYKDPGATESQLLTNPVTVDRILDRNTSDFHFAASVAGFGHLLRDSAYKGDLTADQILGMAKDSLGKDHGGYRKEFVELVQGYTHLNQ